MLIRVLHSFTFAAVMFITCCVPCSRFPWIGANHFPKFFLTCVIKATTKCKARVHSKPGIRHSIDDWVISKETKTRKIKSNDILHLSHTISSGRNRESCLGSFSLKRTQYSYNMSCKNAPNASSLLIRPRLPSHKGARKVSRDP